MIPPRPHDLHPVSRSLAAVALVALSPVLAATAIAVKLSSPGPVLFRANRIGQSGESFLMLKFRTMREPLPDESTRITGARDARVFPVGGWLRRWKLDELPQLLNVVRGDMVLVGPRPEDPTVVADFYTPFMLQTLTVRPGLTSPGSLDYYAGELRLPADPAKAERLYVTDLLPHKIALDLVYVEGRTWRYDIELVIRTLACLLGFRSAFVAHCQREQMAATELLSLSRSVLESSNAEESA